MSMKVKIAQQLAVFAFSCVSIAIALASATNAQRSVLDEMAPLLKIEKTTMASVMKKERHVSKQLERTVSNCDKSFSAFTVEIFYGDAGDGCDCVFFKNNHTEQVYEITGILGNTGAPVENLAWNNNQTLSFEGEPGDSAEVVRYEIDVKRMKLISARQVRK